MIKFLRSVVMFKKAISILLSIIFILGCIPMAHAASTASLYGIYGDSMLFQQNEDAIFAGTATSGAKIIVELYNSANTLIRKYSSYAQGGVFEVSFPSPEGSYEEYTVVLYVDGTEFDRLEKVVFGELWLASGQSNMAYTLKQEATGSKMYEAGQKLSKWIRAFIVPGTPKYNDSSSATPVNPQNDLVGAQWVTGEHEKIYSLSAVAYFFAEKLQKKLDMPVGVMHNALGGSTINSWLSRDAIDRCPNVKSTYTSIGKYITTSAWSTSAPERYQTMTANYNVKIHPTRHFRPAGMIWYQGESDLFNQVTPKQYAEQLDLLQRSYSELFGYEDELMPLVCTQLAPFKYSSSGLEFSMWNNALANFVDHEPDVRSVVSNYDVNLSYLPDMGYIHPKTKQEIGVRMAECAEGLVYTNDGPTSVAQPESYEVRGSDIYIYFDDNVGDGLASDGLLINGFSICAANGVYVPANAEIVDDYTVRVWAKGVTAPVSAAYAYCTNNVNSNLYSTKDGKLLMPVCPFFLKYIEGAHFWRDKEWLDCEEGTTFHNYGDGDSIFYYTWGGADTSFDVDAAYSGNYGLQIYTTKKEFSIKPILTYDDDGDDVPFEEIDTDYSDYSTMTFHISNGLPVEFRIESIDFYVGDTILDTYYSPVCTATGKTGITVPGNCPWVTITFDLNKLYKNGKTSGTTYDNSKLEDIWNIKFNFSQTAGGAIVNLDEIRFTPENGNIGLGNISGTPQLVLSKSEINANYTPGDYSSNMPESVNELAVVVTPSLSVPDGATTVIDNEKNLVYGLETGLDENSIMSFLKVTGNAKITFSNDNYGTGTVVTLTDSATNTVISEYTIVIFGDYNGDGIVDALDTSCFATISNYERFDYYDYEYLFMAADVNGDGVVDAMDEEAMNMVANYEAYIDQTVTEGSKVFNY